jgi:hypothetical protein
MALDVDGFAVLRNISCHRDTFGAIAADVAKAARMLVIQQIVHKDAGLKSVREVRAAVGPEAFGLITDGMSDAQIKSLAAKLDKYNSEIKVSTGAAQRPHVMALAEGSVEPLEKSKSAPRPKKLKKAQAPLSPADRIHFSSASATRKR